MSAPTGIIKKFLTYIKLRDIMTMLKISGCSLVVELQPSKLIVWVRFPSSAPKTRAPDKGAFIFWQSGLGIERA